MGISLSHIFIIDKAGSLQHQVAHTVVTSYGQQADMLDMIFSYLDPPSVKTARLVST